MIKIRYTPDDDALVEGPRGTRLVEFNGRDYSVMEWSPHHKAWTDVVINHAGEVMSAALAAAVEFVK
jgi:hypothetical protein